MDELYIIGIWFGLHILGVFFALLAKGKPLTGMGIISIVIGIPYFFLLLSMSGPGTGSTGFDGVGPALLTILLAPIGLPAIGFMGGWAAKFALKDEVKFWFPLNYLWIGVMIFGPFLILFNSLALQPHLKKSHAEDFTNNNTAIPKLITREKLHLDSQALQIFAR